MPMTTPKKSNGHRRSGPKLFRCTGFGDCNMVFTRSEHLARHERKHTGEKPFTCVVPGCERKFSRFDNMIQHTRTHDPKKRKESMPQGGKSAAMALSKKQPKDRRNSIAVAPSAAGMKRPSDHDAYAPYAAASMMGYAPTPASMASNPATGMPPVKMQRSQSYQPPLPAMLAARTLPPPSSSGRRPSSAYYPPPPLSRSPPESPPDSRRSSIHYDLDQFHYSPPPKHPFHDEGYAAGRQSGVRRLSLVELQAPIQSLSHMDHDLNNDDEAVHPLYEKPAAPVVDITSDEYEALQGFSKFSLETPTTKKDVSLPSLLRAPPPPDHPLTHQTHPMYLPPIKSPRSSVNSPNIPAQVAAFRQTVLPTNESNQRPHRQQHFA